MPPSGRQYSEAEIAQLLRRATELQNLDEGSRGAGLSLEDVEQIALETGIDPTYVRAAAADLLRVPVTAGKKGFHILGAPIYLDAERTVDGTLTDEVWAGIADELSRTYRTSGRSQAVGAGREWTYGGARSLREVRVSATPVKGKTRIRITEEFGREAFLNFFMPIYGFAVIMGLLVGRGFGMGPEVGIPIVIALVATLFLGLRMVFSTRIRKREQRHQELLDRIQEMVEIADAEGEMDALQASRSSDAPVTAAGSERHGAHIELPEPSDSEESESSPERRRVR